MSKKIDSTTMLKKSENEEMDLLFSQFDEKFVECETKITIIKKHIDEYREGMEKDEEKGDAIENDNAESSTVATD